MYGRFSAGFDTADLVDAKSLLDSRQAGLAGGGALPSLLVKRVFLVVAAASAAYVAFAYVVMPMAWKEDARRHASFEDSSRVTETKDGHPGDPLNVALIGTELELAAVMEAARWAPAAALGLDSDLEIAADAVLARPDAKAPVSNLYLFGRKQDLAYEQQVGKDPRHRHHVRFWRMDELGHDGRPVWIGSAAYDEGVGLSRATGQITHHIAADVDAERDYLFHDLERSGDLSEAYPVEGFHETREGRNGGGDPWHTDGDLRVGVVEPDL